MKYLFWIIIFLVLFIRFIVTTPKISDGQKVKISGTIFSEPSAAGSLQKFNLSGIPVKLSGDNEIHYGDFVIVEGLYQNGELTKAKLDEIKVSNNIFTNLRKRLLDFYEGSLPQPYASLVAGITVGAKSSLSYNFKTKLNNTGTSHIVVASGTNVTILAGFLMSIFITKLSRKKTLILTIISIWFYTLITGFEAPIIRASIMGTIAFTAVIFGKVANSLRLTFLTGIIMVIIVPSWITDIGFLLSFSTTFSIILFQSKINKIFKFMPEILKEDLATTLSAQLGSLPIILYFFGKFNPLSPIINILVLWTVPIIMVIGGVSGAVSFIFPGLAKLILDLSFPLTTYFVGIVSL